MSSLPPQPSACERIISKLPKDLQKFIKSCQRKFGNANSDDDFKNLMVSSPDPLGKGKLDLKGAKGPAGLNRKASTMDNLKSDRSTKPGDKNAKPGKPGADAKKSVDAGSQSKSKLSDNSKQEKEQQKKQNDVDSKTQNLAINPKQPAGKADAKTETKLESKDGKDKKGKKDNAPQITPVIQVPGK